MSQISKNGIFYNNSNIKDRMYVLYDKLKRHLSSEYLDLTEKKDNLESDVIQMKIELEKRDKTLFPNQEKKDDRKYFTPLNIESKSKKKEDDKERQLATDINRLNQEIDRMESRMADITDFLKEMEYINDYNKAVSLKDRDEESGSDDPSFESDIEDDTDSIEDDMIVEKRAYFRNRQIYPQMIRNLYDLSDYYQNTFPGLEVLIEYNDNNIELDPDDIKNILEQLVMNIEYSLNIYGVSMILIQGNVSQDVVNISLNYICDDKSFDTVKISYNIIRIH